MYVIQFLAKDAVYNETGLYGYVKTRRVADSLVEQLNNENDGFLYDWEWVYNRDDEVNEDK